MTLSTRLLVAKSLEKHGRIAMNNTYANVANGLVRFTGKQEDIQKELTLPNGEILENPMTWDTFTHIYLLYK